MKIIKIFPMVKYKNGIFVEADNQKKYLLSRSLLAELRNKLIDVKPADINIDLNPLVLSKVEIDNAEVINTYNYLGYEFMNEDLKAVCEVRG